MWLSICSSLFSAFNLRSLLTSVAPLLRDIRADLSLSNFWVSVLMTVPVICLGVFGPLAASFVEALQARVRSSPMAVVAALASTILRSFGLVPLYMGTILIG